MRGTRSYVATALAAAAGLVGAPSAEASVTLGESRVVVRSAAGAVVAERAPFRLSFRDGQGRTVLSEVENTRPGPTPQAFAPNAFPLGLQPVRGNTLYSPLTFVVGANVTTQNVVAVYGGNQLAGLDGGVIHSARDVIAARREGDGATLDVATSDGDRTLEVTLRPEGDAFRVSVRPSSPDGIAVMGDSFDSGPDEAFRGFGGRHNQLDQAGGDFYNWVEQENVEPGNVPNVPGPLPGGQGDRYMFPNGPTAAYYVQSLFYSSRPYGFLLDRPELTRWRLKADRPDAWQVTAAAAGLDYLVAPGSAHKAIRTLTRANGIHELPPRWAFGASIDRSVQALSDTAESYEAKVLEDLENIDKYGFPLKVYRLEGWRAFSDERNRELIAEFHKRGIKVTAYFKAFISSGGTLFDENADYDEAIEKGYLAKTPAGTPFLFQSVFGNGVAGLLDVTNPDAVRWYQDRLRRALDLGFDGFMEDFGEQTFATMVFANGETGQTMHNRYPILYHRATQELREAYTRETGREVLSFVRSGFSGTRGSAAFEQANFGGDYQSTWGRANGIGGGATDMLNRGVGGAIGYMTDIGGYLDTNNPATTPELLTRWAQWAALSPFFRLHNGAGTGARMPWSFEETHPDVLPTYTRYARLHEAAIPLIIRLWREARRTGIPIARPLWLAFPGDEKAAEQDQQWMLGPDVLVAPIVKEGATGREVYFPAGKWVHPETGERYTGPASAEVEAPLDTLPYFFRGGAQPFRPPASEAGLPPAGRCVGRQRFTITLPRTFARAQVRIAGRGTAVRRQGGRLRAVIDLRGRQARRVRVRVIGKTRDGRRVAQTRTYRLCRKK